MSFFVFNRSWLKTQQEMMKQNEFLHLKRYGDILSCRVETLTTDKIIDWTGLDQIVSA